MYFDVFLGLLFYLAIIGGIIYLYYRIAKKFEAIAFQKGYDESIHSLAMCFWLGIIGYLYVIALPDRSNKKDDYMSFDSPPIYTAPVPAKQYKCPRCQTIVQQGVSHCPVCTQKFTWSQ